MHHYIESGLDTIYLMNGYMIETDSEFGELLTIMDVNALQAAIAEAVLDRPGPLTGAEFRFLRTHLGLTQKQLAERLATNEQSIAKFEKAREKPVGNRPMERLFRAVALHEIVPSRVAAFLKHAAQGGLGGHPGVYRFRHSATGWQQERLAA